LIPEPFGEPRTKYGSRARGTRVALAPEAHRAGSGSPVRCPSGGGVRAVRHGTPPLRLILDRTLTCEVHDSSPVAPHLHHARTIDEGGRGLFIVSRLAAHGGTRYSTDGKTLWTEQELGSATDGS